MRSFVLGAALASSLWGCGDDVHKPHGPGDGGSAGESACPPGTPELDDGSCLIAGLPAEQPACPAGEIEGPTGACCPAGSEPLASRDCRPAGIEPGECAAGFASDGARSCVPILADAPCPPGEMALLGETTCHEIAPCGSGTWGSIAVDVDTQHVDAAFTGGGNDGSAQAPWTTIQAAVDAAAPGAVVAIAEGAYAENVLVAGKPVHLWGRCPDRVSIAPASGTPVQFGTGSSQSEVHALAVTGGDWYGIENLGAGDLLVENAWIHDTAFGAIRVHDAQAPASLVLRSSLIESTHVYAVTTYGGAMLVEDSVIRDTQPSTFNGTLGFGLFVQPGTIDGAVTVRRTLLERNHEIAVVLIGRSMLIEASAILDTLPSVAGGHAIGLNSTPGKQPELTLRSSYLGNNQEAGISVQGGNVDIADTVIASTTPGVGNPLSGYGVLLLADADGVPSVASLRHVVVEQSAFVGVSQYGGGSLLVEGSIVRATQPSGDETGGIGVLSGGVDSLADDLRVHYSVVADNHQAGVQVQSGTAEVLATLVSDTLPQVSDGELGLGISAQPDLAEPSHRPAITITSSRVTRSHTAGLLVNDTDAVIELVHVDDTRPQASDGQRGHALTAGSWGDPPTDEPSLTMSWCLFEQSNASAVIIAGTRAHLHATAVRDVESSLSEAWGTGLTVQHSFENGAAADVTLDSCAIERASGFGVLVFDSTAAVHASLIADTRPDTPTGLYGDGLAVMSYMNDADLIVTDSLIVASARVGLSSFGSVVSLGRTGLTCNGIDLGGEEFSGRAFSFVDLGGNACGCGDVPSNCRMVSAELEPPPPLEPSSP